MMEVFEAITKYPNEDPVLSELIMDVPETVPFNEEYEPLRVGLLPMDCNSLSKVWRVRETEPPLKVPDATVADQYSVVLKDVNGRVVEPPVLPVNASNLRLGVLPVNDEIPKGK